MINIEELFSEMEDVGFDVELVDGYPVAGVVVPAIHLKDKHEHGHLLTQFPEVKQLRLAGFLDGVVFY
jgi:hypothetical protein